MSEVKFTPGPWCVFEDIRTDKNPYGRDSEEYIAGFNIESGNYEVVGCDGISGGSDIERANAHLIAAAPELYEALEEMSSCLSDIISGNDWGAVEEYLDDARAALAKARGE